MSNKQESVGTPPTPIPAPAPVKTYCGNCGIEERRFLHHVRHRGIFRRLCTTCVLRLHPQSFCPTCFCVYEHPHRSPPDAITCFKCYSASHSRCVGSTPASSPYVCPLCSSPGPASQIFSLTFFKAEGHFGIDKKSANILLAAARIAASSMSKAAAAAKAEADRRAKEAAFMRKRAREALEHVTFLAAKDKLKRQELAASAELSGSGANLGREERNFSKTGNGIIKGDTRSVASGALDRMDRSSEVLDALNAVELSEKEKARGLNAQNAVPSSSNNSVLMDVEESYKSGMVHCSNVETSIAQNRAINSGDDRTGNLGRVTNNNVQGEASSAQNLAVGNDNASCDNLGYEMNCSVLREASTSHNLAVGNGIDSSGNSDNAMNHNPQ